MTCEDFLGHFLEGEKFVFYKPSNMIFFFKNLYKMAIIVLTENLQMLKFLWFKKNL